MLVLFWVCIPSQTSVFTISSVCNPQAEDGLRMLEAMLFAVKEINDKPDFLPGIRLGVVAYDTCDSPAYALEQSLDFIKGSLTPLQLLTSPAIYRNVQLVK